MGKILVTGASGFVAKHLIGQLLEAGYEVRGTVRGQAKVPGIWAAVDALTPGKAGQLELVEAEPRLDRERLERLRDRAEDQRTRVEELREKAAREAFAG